MSEAGAFWRGAARRFAANRPAMAALAALLAIALFCGVGPLLSTHSHERAYPDYVKARPSLSPHPSAAEADAALARVAARMHARVAEGSLAGAQMRATLEADAPIDPRLIAYFERSGVFGKAEALEASADGKRLALAAPLRQESFLAGTDANGRDLLARMMVAGRVSLLVAALGSGVALAIGVLYGAVAGYAGGRVDMAMMRAVDILYALPFIFFVILLVVFFGRHFVLIFVAIGSIEWLDMARIVRGQTLSLKRREFVAAAQALGLGPWAVLRRHILPNLAGVVTAYLALLAPRVILLESFLSFLGLGVQEPLTSLGALVADGAHNIEDAPYLLIFPAAMLSLLLLSLNFLGDGLRDALDPRER